MQSYLAVLNDFIQNKSEFWDYYGLQYRDADEIFSDPLRFIHALFIYAQKKMLTPFSRYDVDTEVDSFLTKKRAAHSVSTFFFGAMIAQKVFTQDFGALYSSPPTARRLDGRDKFDFSYIWTLTSLFHDYGYYYERSLRQAERLRESRLREWHQSGGRCGTSLQHFMRQNNIGFTVWKPDVRCRNSGRGFHDHSEAANSQLLHDAYLRSPEILYFPQSERTIQTLMRDRETLTRYFDMQLYAPSGKDKPHIEHGIAGGSLFFDRILKNYRQAYEQEQIWQGDEVSIEAFHHNGLNFSFEQLPLFAYISNTIMNHNIWKASSKRDEVEKYIHFGLGGLVGNHFAPICFWTNPLLFVLDVADSLEPYKLFGNVNGDEYSKDELLSLLDSLQIGFEAGRMIVKPPVGKWRRLKNKLTGMEDWIELKYSKPERNTYEIIMRTD